MQKIISPHCKSYEEVLIFTNKKHTNTLGNGIINAKLSYFNIIDYF